LKALKIAGLIAENSLHSVRLAKRAVGSFEQTQVKKGLQVEWECYKKDSPSGPIGRIGCISRKAQT
jgi:hypothetical protein